MLKPCAQTSDLPGVTSRLDVLLEDAALLLVRDEHHDHVSLARRFGNFGDLQPGLLGRRPGLRALVQADHDVEARIVRVQRVGVALAAIADDGHAFAFEGIDRRVGFGVDVCGHVGSSLVSGLS